MKQIKLMADYQCYPLLNVSAGESGDIESSELPISKELQQRLLKWVAIYNETLDQDYPPNSGFKTQELERKFKLDGESLAECLKAELGSGFSVAFEV